MNATEIRYLDPKKVRFWLPDGASSPRLEVEDECCLPTIILRRVFPLSNDSRYLSVQDASGKEVGVIRDVAELPSESQRAIHFELDRRYFTPKIGRIANLKQEGGMWTWQVETNRGEATFYVRSWRDSSYEMQPGRYMIQSVDGQRFEIPSYENLDDRSKLFIEQLF